MKKIFLIVILFVSVSVFAKDLDVLDFSDLSSLSKSEQMAFMQGFIVGSYAAAVLVNRMHGLPSEDALSLMILDESPETLLKETLQWYKKTGQFQVPIYVAVYRRRI